jgi:serine/threonine protein kinase
MYHNKLDEFASWSMVLTTSQVALGVRGILEAVRSDPTMRPEDVAQELFLILGRDGSNPQPMDISVYREVEGWLVANWHEDDPQLIDIMASLVLTCRMTRGMRLLEEASKSSNPEVRARFEREAKTVSSLNHPNICTLFDIGREGETDYLVMELVEGETLAERLTRGPLAIPDALKIAGQIADALEAAHERGIVHRDLKPANVFIDRDGAVKILDFGIARLHLLVVLDAAKRGERRIGPAVPQEQLAAPLLERVEVRIGRVRNGRKILVGRFDVAGKVERAELPIGVPERCVTPEIV